MFITEFLFDIRDEKPNLFECDCVLVELRHPQHTQFATSNPILPKGKIWTPLELIGSLWKGLTGAS
jgi:hypothetical protein